MKASINRKKLALRAKRKIKIRGKISGCSTCPRVTIFKSNRTLYVQAIEDINGTTLCASSGLALRIKANKDGAIALANDFAAKLKDKGIKEAVFDRNGYLYHGVIAAFAQALRDNDIKI